MQSKRILLVITLGILFGLTSARAEKGSRKANGITLTVEPQFQPVRQLFSLEDVRVTDKQMAHLEKLDCQYIKSLEVGRLLSLFRKEAGVSQHGYEPYPLWESQDLFGGGPLAGHIMGFWLSSMAMMYESTGDTSLKPKVMAALNGLRECQEADGEGFIGAQPGVKALFAEVAKGNFATTNPLINNLWEPVYIMNKTMLGLYDVWRAFDIELAKTILVDLATWFGTSVLDRLDHEQVQRLLVCEHGSINESYVDVYSLTGEKKFLDWADRLNDEDMWVPAAEGRDVLKGWHANTQIPKFTGFERVYTYTGNDAYRRAARFFWQTVVDRHTWANGGNSTGEHFFPISEFENRLTNAGGPESCNSVNMMRLTESLYQDDGDMKYVDYYERVLLNHILANYDPIEGMCVYYTSMRPANYKIYGTKYDSFWCCTGTGMQAPAKFGKMIYAHAADTLFVNLYIASSMTWQEQGISLRQETAFPVENTVQVMIESGNGKQTSTIALRHPWWSNGMEVTVNGVRVETAATENGYVAISRQWKAGDKVEVTLHPGLHAEVVKGGSRFYAFMYGPVLLGTRIDDESMQMSDYRDCCKTVPDKLIPIDTAPEINSDINSVLKNMQRADSSGVLRFLVPEGLATRSFYLEPYNNIHFTRYAIYLHTINPNLQTLKPHVLQTTWGTQWGNMEPVDLKNDGSMQLLIGAAHVAGNEDPFAAVLKSMGTRWYESRPFSTACDRPSYSVCDMNGDGIMDVVISETRENDETQGIFLGNGDGTMTKSTMSIVRAYEGLPSIFTTPFSRFSKIQCSAVADFNNDGLPDIVGVGNNENYVVLLNQGDLAFRPIYFDAGTEYGRQGHQLLQACVRTADLNGDGFQDIVVSFWKRGVGGGVGHDREYFTEVYLNSGDGTDFQRTWFADKNISCGNGGIAIGDVNGDGFQDIVLNGYGGLYGGMPEAIKETGDDNTGIFDRVFLCLNDGTGHFTLANKEDFERPLIRSFHSGQHVLNLYDWDGDGYLDIITNGYAPGDNDYATGYIYMNNQGNVAGRFAHGFYYAGGSEGTNCLIDWDGDGLKDIVATGWLRCSKFPDIEGRSFAVTLCNQTATDAPQCPTAPKAKVDGNRVTLSWTPADKAATSTTYELYIKTHEGVMLGNCRAYTEGSREGQRKCEDAGNVGSVTTITYTLPAGNYEWGVQAVDGRHVGSAFAKGTFFIDPAGIHSVNDSYGPKPYTNYNLAGQQTEKKKEFR